MVLMSKMSKIQCIQCNALNMQLKIQCIQCNALNGMHVEDVEDIKIHVFL